jgi:hypothetical protein
VAKAGFAFMRAGLGLYSCIWAFVPYDEFFRVAGMRVSLDNCAERKAYATWFDCSAFTKAG